MGHTNDRSTKATSLVNPTSLNLQPRPFAPLESDEKEEAISRKSGYSENFLEKIINTPRSESATPIQRKSGNPLKAIATERNNASLQNQPIQRQEAVEEEKSEGEQEDTKEFTMNPEPPPVQRKFENRLRAKNAQRMAIQAKLAIGEPNDKYEQEADATAARVVQQINSPTTSQSEPVQRKFENRLRAKNAQKMALQPKLAIGEPNDKYEQEANATAARVVQQINSSIPSQSQPIQRQEMEEDEELQMKPLVQRSENIGGGEASTDLESAIQSARGSGQSLDANLQQSMGQAMGADFSGVKVHTDSQSDQLNKSIQAKAFTTGQDLFFRQGAYEPSSRGGQELIAHELTHVVQQNGGAVQRSPLSSGQGENDCVLDNQAESVAPLITTQNLGIESDVVQRMIGYEFETPVNLRNKKGKKFVNLSKADTLIEKDGLELQADTNPVTGSNIEFVSKAFKVTPKGKEDMQNSLAQLTEWSSKIEEYSSKAPKGGNGYETDPVLMKDYISGVDDSIYMRPTKRQVDGNPQVTAGLTLEELHSVLTDYEQSGETGSTKTEDQKKDQKTVTSTFIGSGGVLDQKAYKKILTEARGEVFVEDESEETQHLSKALQSMIWLITSYLTTIDLNLETKSNRPFKNSKEVSIILSRNNFSTLFQTIPPEEQQILKAQPELLVKAVELAGGGDMSKLVYPYGFLKGSQGNQKVISFALTRQEWVESIPKGQDKLTKEYWEDYDEETNSEKSFWQKKQRSTGQDVHKSLGGYSDKQDNDRGYDQAVFEFRKMPPGITPEQFAAKMINAWAYLESKMKS